MFLYKGSIFANPYKTDDCENVEDCINKYIEHARKNLYEYLDLLKNKNIACFCKVEDRCHLKVLVQLLWEKENLNKQK